MSAKSTIAGSALDDTGARPEWHVYVERLWDHDATDVTLEVRGVVGAECTIFRSAASVTVTLPSATWWAIIRACARKLPPDTSTSETGTPGAEGGS